MPEERYYALQAYYESRNNKIVGGRVCFLKSNREMGENSRLVREKLKGFVNKDTSEFDIKNVIISLDKIPKEVYEFGIW
jgi:hypothetical protein